MTRQHICAPFGSTPSYVSIMRRWEKHRLSQNCWSNSWIDGMVIIPHLSDKLDALPEASSTVKVLPRFVFLRVAWGMQSTWFLKGLATILDVPVPPPTCKAPPNLVWRLRINPAFGFYEGTKRSIQTIFDVLANKACGYQSRYGGNTDIATCHSKTTPYCYATLWALTCTA